MKRLAAVFYCLCFMFCTPILANAGQNSADPFPSPVEDTIFSQLTRCIDTPQNANAAGAEICHLRASTAYKSAISDVYDLAEKTVDSRTRIALKKSQDQWLTSQRSDFLLWQGNWVNTRGEMIGSQMAAITTQTLQSRLFELYLYLSHSQQAEAQRIIRNAFR